jgi:CRP-like cAMP-binding protein
MEDLIKHLKDFILFRNLEDSKLKEILVKSHYRLKNYKTEEVIALEGTPCQQLGFILDGAISINKIYPSGRTVAIATLNKGKIFGEVVLFSDHNIYPSTVIASTDCSILFFEKEKFIDMCNFYPQIYENLLRAFSDRILLLNQKITNLSFKSIRQKIIHHLFQVYKQQQKQYIDIPHSRSDWAELLGIPRPSLSRELIKMKEANLIDFDKSTVKLIDLNALEEELFK